MILTITLKQIEKGSRRKMPKHAGGRPRKITPHIARKIFLLAGYGLTDEQLADVFDISRDTIAEAKKQPEFSYTIAKCKQEADLKVINALYHRATGYSHADEVVRTNVLGSENDKYVEVTRIPTTKHYPPDTEAIKFWLMNRRRDDWRKEIQHEETRPMPPMIRLFSKLNNDEIAVINRGQNQVDVLLGEDFVKSIKEKNGTRQLPHTNGNSAV